MKIALLSIAASLLNVALAYHIRLGVEDLRGRMQSGNGDTRSPLPQHATGNRVVIEGNGGAVRVWAR